MIEMILGIGIDVIEVKRIAKAIKNVHFLERVYTSGELEFFQSRRGNPLPIAGNFAAKEAVAKALGTGFGTVKWTDIEVLRNAEGAPYVLLYGKAAEIFKHMGGSKIWISISHSKEYAVAQAIIEAGRE